ncbi:hypothetical protein C2S52_014770 [Perilla frutescens var. hirtella]|nr:hypothetical protein C2S52_014770 [Perilla frutescens var. hirtella]
MSTIFASISSNLFKKSIPLYASTTIPKQKKAIVQYGPQTCSLASFRVSGRANDPTYVPGKSPPEVPTAPPSHNPGIPPELPRRHNVPEFDPIPPEKPEPVPPGEPEVIPPHGPEITPPKPPEPGPPHPTPPDIPPPIMGSNGLAFY